MNEYDRWDRRGRYRDDDDYDRDRRYRSHYEGRDQSWWQPARDSWDEDERDDDYWSRRRFGESYRRGREDLYRPQPARSFADREGSYDSGRFTAGYGTERSRPYPDQREHWDPAYAWNYGSSPEEQFYRGFGDDADRRPARDYRRGDRDDHRRERRSDERGFIERASDQVASWFGDDDAERRRDRDHRGRGPAGYTRSDERIREEANDRLTDHPRVDARNITVAVESGEVLLSGTVTSREQKRRAEDCIEDISGVHHVQNNLRVQDHAGAASALGTSSAAGRSTTE